MSGSGKDTVANFLCTRYNFVKLSFASVLKDIVAIVFDWPRPMLEGDTRESREWREQEDSWWASKLCTPGLTPRRVLQMIGTDVMRTHFHKDIWIFALEKRLRTVSANVVVTDARFPNEVAMLRDCGGIIVKIQRGPVPDWFEDYLHDTSRMPEDVHPSEYAWAPACEQGAHIVLMNNGTIEDLHHKVDAFYSSCSTPE